MAKGKTISVTLPERVVQHYDEKAKELGMSRSSVICDIIMANFELKQSQERVANVSSNNLQTENS